MEIEIKFSKVEPYDSRDPAVISIPVAVKDQDSADLLVASIAEAFDEFAPGMVLVELGSCNEPTCPSPDRRGSSAEG